MITRTNISITAISFMAVMFIGLCFWGCATPRQVEEIRAEIAEVKAQNQETQQMLAHTDSVITAEGEAGAKLRGDLAATISDVQQQMATLLENYKDLMQKLADMNQKKATLSSSPGAQEGQAGNDTSKMDCGLAYDDAFVLVRRNKYAEAIEGFNQFLKNCPKHESVENAYYWIGECYYSLGKYHEAITQFNLLMKEFKGSPNLSRALYKLGRSQQELGKKEDARKTFKKLVDEFAGTLEAEQAKERLKELK
jgi:tol-pal system protein YbgF